MKNPFRKNPDSLSAKLHVEIMDGKDFTLNGLSRILKRRRDHLSPMLSKYRNGGVTGWRLYLGAKPVPVGTRLDPAKSKVHVQHSYSNGDSSR